MKNSDRIYNDMIDLWEKYNGDRNDSKKIFLVPCTILLLVG